MIEKKTPKGVNFSDFICTFAMSFSILLFFSNTRISEISDMAKSRITYRCSGAYKKINYSVAKIRKKKNLLR